MNAQLKSHAKNHICVVCMGEACCRKGSGAVLEAMQHVHDTDSHLIVYTTPCVGQCGSAPAAIFDRKLATRLNPNSALERVDTLINHAAA